MHVTPGRGFTLIELLVVLVIMVTGTLAIAAAMPEFGTRSAVDASALQLAAMMRKARMLAIAKERIVVMSMDADNQRYWIDNTNYSRALPKSVRVSFTGRNPRLDIRFYPDGTADLHEMLLSDGRQRRGLTISPVTGYVSVQR